MRIVFDMAGIEAAVRSLKSMAPVSLPHTVMPVSVPFTPPPAPRSEKIVVEDLGVVGSRLRQNDGRRFRDGGAR